MKLQGKKNVIPICMLMLFHRFDQNKNYGKIICMRTIYIYIYIIFPVIHLQLNHLTKPLN